MVNENLQLWLMMLVAFGVMWTVPLLMPVGSLERYAFEELRVIVVGFMLGVLFLTLYQRRRRKR